MSNKKGTRSQRLLKFLLAPALGAAAVLGAAFGSMAMSAGPSVSRQSANVTTSSGQTLADANIRLLPGSVNNEPQSNSAGEYFLAGQSGANQAIVKLSPFGTVLYSTNVDSGYQIRQIVKDLDDENFYYVLVVDPTTTITATGDSTAANTTLTINGNKAKVLQFFDTGSALEKRKTYSLDLPNFKTTVNSVGWGPKISSTQKDEFAPYRDNGEVAGRFLSPSYDESDVATVFSKNEVTYNSKGSPGSAFDKNPFDSLWVESPISSTTTNDNLVFLRTKKQTTGESLTDATNSAVGKILGNYTTGVGETSGTAVLTPLYLNNASNMVYTSDNQHKMIMIFGGSAAQNFWFYAFEVKAQETVDNAEVSVPGRLYANYQFNYITTNNQTVTLGYDASDNGAPLDPQKMRFNAFTTNWMAGYNLAVPAWFVSGASTVVQNGQKYVVVGMQSPNMQNFNQNHSTTTTDVYLDTEKGFGATGTDVSKYDDTQMAQLPTTYWGMLVGASSINSAPFATGKNARGVADQAANASTSSTALTYDYSSSFSMFGYRSLSLWSVMSASTAWQVANWNFADTTAAEPVAATNDDNENPRRDFDLFDVEGIQPLKISVPAGWTISQKSSNTTDPNYQDVDPYSGFSRALGEWNPTATNAFTTANGDGWLNSASQHFVAMDAQVLSDGTVAALSLFRGNIGVVHFKPTPSGQSIYADTANVNWTTLGFQNKNLDFTKLQSISFSNDTWYLTYANTEAAAADTTPASAVVYALYASTGTNNSLATFSQTSIATSGATGLNMLLPLSSNAIYALQSNSTTTTSPSSLTYWTKLPDALPSEYTQNSAYSATNQSVQSNSAVWGTPTPITDAYIKSSGLDSRTANEIAADSASWNSLVTFTPGWSGQGAPIVYNVVANSPTELSFSIALQNPNGRYYGSQVPNASDPNAGLITQASGMGLGVQTLGGFATLPSWVLPVAIGVSIGFVVIALAIGLGIGLPLAKNKKLQEQGFTTTFRKVDTLTSAVGSVYKKIITQTSAVKKKPQMLAAKRPGPVAPGAPRPAVAPGGRPSVSTPAKPGAPAAPRPAGGPVKPAAPSKPAAAPRPAGTPPAKPAAPSKPAAAPAAPKKA